MTDRLAAWERLHEALAGLPGWRVSPPQDHAERHVWRVTAFNGRHHGRGKPHEAMDAEGATEPGAVEALARFIEDRVSRV